MNNLERADTVTDLITTFRDRNLLNGESSQTIISDMICNLLHWAEQCIGPEGRKTALEAARCGLSNYITESQSGGDDGVEQDCYVLITARCGGGLWVSETGNPEVIKTATAPKQTETRL